MAAGESVPAHEAGDLCATLRHALVPPERAAEFRERVAELTREFAGLPREGDTVYGSVAGPYPTGHPALPAPGRDA